MKEDIEVEESEPGNAGTPEEVADLPVVGLYESGFGHPYAPQNWPKPGDNWRWKVGSRVTRQKYYADRYLYAPKSLPHPRYFASRASLEKYITKEFPNVDLQAFFGMFSWNIPAGKPTGSPSDQKASSSPKSSRDMKGNSNAESQSPKCPAGSRHCEGLLLEVKRRTMPCDICCMQSDFCRHCSCILCSRIVKPDFGGFSYFRCESETDEPYICGHVAHLNCALSCKLAGTVGGNYKLDAAYYCRRCDSASDLVAHATKILETCKSVNCSIEMEKILKLGIDLLRGSERESAQVLLSRLKAAFSMLKNRSTLISIWDALENTSTVPLRGLQIASEVNAETTTMDSPETTEIVAANSPDEQEINPLQIEVEIDNTLRSLKESQEAEYRQAEEKLNAQKIHLIHLHEQLQHEKSQLAALSSSAERNDMLDIVRSREEHIRKAYEQLKEMQEVYKLSRKVP